jgi:hypothetical protein
MKTAEWLENANWRAIPDYMREGIARYIDHGIKPGDFLTAVISNDLKGAFRQADDTNVKIIGEYVRFFYAWAPPQCWGSPEKMQAWMERGDADDVDA